MRELIASFSSMLDKKEDETLDIKDFGELTHQQVHYLNTLSKLGNPTLTELANSLRLSKPSVTVLVDKLIQKGYVYKVKSDEDRRSQHLHLAEKGLAFYEAYQQVYDRLSDAIKAKLTPTEVVIFKEILAKIIRTK